MDANSPENRKLLLKEEVYAIVGCAMEVLNELGNGLREKTYERALLHEFGLRSIEWSQQREFPVYYKGIQIDVFIPDLIVFDKVVADLKTIEQITDREIGQMLNYLKVTNLSVGVILNFKHARLEWRRVVQGKQDNPEPGSIRHFPDPLEEKHSR